MNEKFIYGMIFDFSKQRRLSSNFFSTAHLSYATYQSIRNSSFHLKDEIEYTKFYSETGMNDNEQ